MRIGLTLRIPKVLTDVLLEYRHHFHDAILDEVRRTTLATLSESSATLDETVCEVASKVALQSRRTFRCGHPLQAIGFCTAELSGVEDSRSEIKVVF